MKRNKSGLERGPIADISKAGNVLVKVGDQTLSVSPDLIALADFYVPSGDDGAALAYPNTPAALAAVVAAVSLGFEGDEAFRWAIATASQRNHERSVAECARATADTQLRTAQITLAIEREKAKSAG